MEFTKQDTAMNEIVYAVTHGEKKAGDMILSRDYDLAKKQMGIVFKTLTEKEIVKRSEANSYYLTENCRDNAQEMYFCKIAELVERIKSLAECANISPEMVFEIFKSELRD